MSTDRSPWRGVPIVLLVCTVVNTVQALLAYARGDWWPFAVDVGFVVLTLLAARALVRARVLRDEQRRILREHVARR